MRVHVDDQIFVAQAYGGISRYFVRIMEAFRQDPALGVEVCMPRIWTRNHDLHESGLGRLVPYRLRKRVALIKALNRRMRRGDHYDLVHHSYYNPAYLEQFAGAGLSAVTIYDMIPEMYPDFFPRGNPHQAKRDYVHSADLILCISETTKREMIRLYGEPRGRVVVTPLGVGDDFSPEASRLNFLPSRYVLYVGARDGYKDFSVLARAFAQARLPSDIRLVAVGGGSPSRDEKKALLGLGIEDRVDFVALSHGEMMGAYAHALAFVYPSRCEGFGLPTLEAMASGCPAVLSGAPSHREVGGDAALFFEAEEPEDLAAQLRRVLSEEELRQRMIERGLARAAEFTWRRTAEETSRAYLQCFEADG